MTSESFYFSKTQWKMWLLLNAAFCRNVYELKFSPEAGTVSGMCQNSLLNAGRENKQEPGVEPFGNKSGSLITIAIFFVSSEVSTVSVIFQKPYQLGQSAQNWGIPNAVFCSLSASTLINHERPYPCWDSLCPVWCWSIPYCSLLQLSACFLLPCALNTQSRHIMSLQPFC